MRLAVVSPFVDRRHGTERALAELLERLAHKENWEIHLYAQRVEGLEVQRSKALRSRTPAAITWHKVPSISGPLLLQYLLWFFLNSFCRAWDRRRHGLRFEVVLSPGINCLDADVIIVHALFHRLQELAGSEEQGETQLGILRRLHRRAYYALLTALERRVYADPRVSLAAVSRRTATLLHKHFCRQDVRVIPNGVDAKQFSPSARMALRAEARLRCNFHEGDFVLLLIGNDWHTKGLETVLSAMGALRDLPFQLVVAGEDAPEGFREKARTLAISERCHFERPREDILNLYAAADTYVSPSREDSFGLPVAEAMACGLPAITSALAGVSELIHSGLDGFVLSDPCDSRELGQLLKDLHGDPGRRQRIGESAATSALKWSWDRHVLAVIELIESVVARK